MIDYYFIASVNEQGEFLVLEKQTGKVGLATFITFEDAKSVFDNAYKVLTTLPPKDMNERAYYFEQIALLRPVILKIPGADAMKIITEWRDPQCRVADSTGIQLAGMDINLLFMKPGFAVKYMVLDVTKDIESITCVAPDGQIQVNVFTFSKGDDLQNRKPITEEEADQILRDRGYM